MRTLTAIRDKVIGKMIDGFGIKKTSGGLIVNEHDGTEEAIRARWFEITHVGPDVIAVSVGDWVYVSHGRWSRGFPIDKSDDTKYYQLDNDEILCKSDEYPIVKD